MSDTPEKLFVRIHNAGRPQMEGPGTMPYLVNDTLPKIGAPATRALASIGVTRLSQLASHRAQDALVGTEDRPRN